MIDNINWYPGHMKKTRQLIEEHLKSVDLIVEILDSRIPVSSHNPIIDDLIKNKRKLYVLSKPDLADPIQTDKWIRHLKGDESKTDVVAVDLRSGNNINQLIKKLNEEQTYRDGSRNVKRPIRMMIVGIPNVGKSSLINRLTGRKSAMTGDKPGVTRGKQWLTLDSGMQLLDTPGILWPKFENNNIGIHLAFCGSIKDDIVGAQDLGFELIKFLGAEYPNLLQERYLLDEIHDDALTNMDNIAIKRGFLMSGKRIDYERTGRTVLDEFRSGKIGRITVEKWD